MKKLLFLMMLVVVTVSCKQENQQAAQFVTVENGHFMRAGVPYYYVGTNFWYGAILGSEGQGGDRERLCRELDEMKRMGIDNLRILVGSDGERGVKTKVEPTLQVNPGNGVGATASIWSMPGWASSRVLTKRAILPSWRP